MKTKKYKLEKSKTAAILLAVFLGIWTFCYTYKYDATKFWLSLLANLLLWWTIIVPVGLSIWAIVHAATRDEDFYVDYYD
jgi:hypothetical protein